MFSKCFVNVFSKMFRILRSNKIEEIQELIQIEIAKFVVISGNSNGRNSVLQKYLLES